jgi:hypothetical protein
MRFLLFNIAVSAAVVYLLVGDPAATARQAGLPEAAVSLIDALSHKAKKTAVESVSKAPQPISQPKSASSYVAKATPKPKPVTKPVVKAIAEKPAPKATPPINQAKFVSSKAIHNAPTPKRNPAAEAKKGDPAPLPPQLSQRRADVLGNGKFAVKDGAAMMSPGDRYRELSKLVDDMELVYFNSLSN